MEIEIFADNLTKNDVKSNRKLTCVRLIMTDNDKIYTLRRRQDNLLYFPNADEEEDSNFKEMLILNEAILTLILTKHDEGMSVINYYYVLENKALPFSLPDTVEGLWINKDELLLKLDLYQGKDSQGAEIEEQEFIALMNII